ncbi:MAG: triose-phosphate isomerase [Deltaproteobacteria bacterium]|nr:triose-phosphate isomerase [Deltaproteobacteria bacterium]MBI3295131.1 triose-phosphate isomerase [Deltaproteobacteria bacterium]
MRQPFFAANWKMNKSIAESGAFISSLVDKLGESASGIGSQFAVVVAPPYTHLGLLADSVGDSRVQISAQNCGVAKSGAFTGEISPSVLKELGCDWAIIGHSERRHVFKEDEILLVARSKAALTESLGVIFCVGETLQDRRAGNTMKVVEGQLRSLGQLSGNSLSRMVLAYEPVWAIGTGENATPAQAEEVHAFMREWVGKAFSKDAAEAVRILYGGSVKPDNAEVIMAQPDVDGLLVGGASLEPVTFAGVVLGGLKGKKLR